MLRNEILPFYFPSTVAFVDDSHDFLVNLSLQLDGRLAFRLFDSPVDALLALNGKPDRKSLVERFFSPSHQSDDSSMSHQVLDMNLDNIVREVHNQRRFEQISVVVVDYDMPEIDGLEFCRNIKDPGVKKILLTGKADEKIAVQAFNQGMIDRFFLKQDSDVIPMLNRSIVELQQAYFASMARTVAETLYLGPHPFLRDECFADEFHRLCKRLGIIEFYLTATPDGFLLLDAEGAATLLIVKTEEGLRSHFEIACDQSAPIELLDRLSSNSVVPYFPNPEGEYLPDCGDWESCLYPATRLQGKECYYYAVVPAPAGARLTDILSYNAFLRWADGQGGGQQPPSRHA
ncbi:response regulator [Paludibacterium yongneupense]|uniref:response regulator n=1 Tax=Paludibacterium yongneupense TaxID=400061 RepID=UPI000420F817|nr:response regulator [Paludibacterium yongneupense]